MDLDKASRMPGGKPRSSVPRQHGMPVLSNRSWISARAAVLLTAIGVSASAQSFDSSANSTVKGDYFVRQVLTSPDPSTSSITRAESLIGVMTFDGNGNYSFTGQLLDSQVGTTAKAYTATGTYKIAANGMAQIQNPIDNTDYEFGAVGSPGPNAIVASATEGQYDDIFVAIPAGSGLSNSSLQGSYRVGFLDFLQGNDTQVRDGYFTLTGNAAGTAGSVSVTGAMANRGSSVTTQTLAGVSYSISSNGSGAITFPTSATPLTALVSGPKNFYISQDGNILLGGSSNGFDIMVGLKSASAVTNVTFNGTYFTSALENDTSSNCANSSCIDSYYGSLYSNAQGTTIAHLRVVGFDYFAYDYTTDGIYNLGSDGLSNDGSVETILGSGGQAFLQVGTGPFYTLTLGIHAKLYTGTGVFLNPIGILNSANFAPITNSVAPGEYLTLFGSGLAAAPSQAQTVPLPATLGGVQVMVNGVAAPLLFVSPTQINMLVPLATATNSNATFAVINNGVSSNKVTVYTAATAPGVFTTTQNGTGPAALLHSDFSLVTQANPAKAGETLSVYVTGLGSVTPAIADGAAAPLTTLSNVDDSSLIVEVSDSLSNIFDPNITFAGLAPGFVGLYQINFTMPAKGVASGLTYLNVGTTDGYTTEATFYVK